MRVEHFEKATLYLGDARDVLPDLSGVSGGGADLCVSDVPYKLTTGGKSKSGRTMQGIFAAHNYDNHGSLMETAIGWGAMPRLIWDALKDDADCYIMSNDKNVQAALNAFCGADGKSGLFALHNLLTWDKISPTANRWYMKNIEFTLYLFKGKARTINDPASKQGIIGRQIDQSDHPTEKPVWLMRYYIENSSQPGDVVLDPFMGSGTTGVAALQCGRRFVGVEVDETIFDMACRRHAALQPCLFSEMGVA